MVGEVEEDEAKEVEIHGLEGLVCWEVENEEVDDGDRVELHLSS